MRLPAAPLSISPPREGRDVTTLYSPEIDASLKRFRSGTRDLAMKPHFPLRPGPGMIDSCSHRRGMMRERTVKRLLWKMNPVQRRTSL
jgi:hypothetical protein